MRVRALLLTSVLVASCGLAACSDQSDTGTTPTPVSSGGSEASPADGTIRGPVLPPAPPPAPAEGCDASKAHFAIGRAASSDLLERARLAAQAKSARFLRPNQPITLEYLGSRLNLNLDASDVVRSVYCG